jgi:hypothetical protein
MKGSGERSRDVIKSSVSKMDLVNKDFHIQKAYKQALEKYENDKTEEYYEYNNVPYPTKIELLRFIVLFEEALLECLYSGSVAGIRLAGSIVIRALSDSKIWLNGDRLVKGKDIYERFRRHNEEANNKKSRNNH